MLISWKIVNPGIGPLLQSGRPGDRFEVIQVSSVSLYSAPRAQYKSGTKGSPVFLREKQEI